ncbi:MAG: AAA family ATPase [Wolinella sp.]
MGCFAGTKDAFVQHEGIDDFIALDTNIIVQEKLKEYILHKPFQILLLTGEPGAGKTCTAEKVVSDLGEDKCYFQKYPFSKIASFLGTLHAHFLPTIALPQPYTREVLVESFREHLSKDFTPTVIIDEIQLYKDYELEIIRMLADTRFFRFVFILHKLERQNVLSQSYFVSRTWGKLELKTLTPKECKIFITQKLLQNGLGSLQDKFGDRQCALLYRFSRGNLRVLCKLCYTALEICEYYEESTPSMLSDRRIPIKCIEMAALDLGVLHE